MIREDMMHHGSRPPPPGGDGACARTRRRGGRGALQASAQPPQLASLTALPRGGARELSPRGVQLHYANAQPARPRQAQADDRRGDASLVSTAPHAQPWHGLSAAISHWKLHRGFRVPPRQAMCRSGWRATQHAGCGCLRRRTHEMAQHSGPRSSALLELRRAASDGRDCGSHRRDSKAADSRAQHLTVSSSPARGRWRVRSTRRRGGRGVLQDSAPPPQSRWRVTGSPSGGARVATHPCKS